MRTASGEENLVKTLGKHLLQSLKVVAQSAVQEIIQVASREGLPLSNIPVLLETLQKERSDSRQYQVLMDIIEGTESMPVVVRREVSSDFEAVKLVVSKHMRAWAVKDMLPALTFHYWRVLSQYAHQVPIVTMGAVPLTRSQDYLDVLFREILTVRSAWFGRGELLRRVVRILPE